MEEIVVDIDDNAKILSGLGVAPHRGWAVRRQSYVKVMALYSSPLDFPRNRLWLLAEHAIVRREDFNAPC